MPDGYPDEETSHGQRTPPVGRRPSSPPPRRRGLLLAAVGLTAVLLGGGAAVLNNQDDTPAGAVDPAEAAATGAAGTNDNGRPGAPAPGAAEGVAGLGAAPKADPSSSAAAAKTPEGGGFQPFAAPRRTLPGASLHLRKGESFGDALRRSDRDFGPLRMVRVFYPGLPPSWNGSRADIVNRTVVVSFKAHPREISSGRHDGKLTAWFASIPRDVDVYWAYFHEPENDVQRKSFTPQQFAAAFKHVSALADKARNPRLRATLILMCWTLNPNSGRDFDAYYPGSAAVDALGWDCYNSGRSSHYTGPDPIFSAAIKKSQQLGKPWGIAETGSVRVASDSSGAGRAAWIRQTSEYLNARKPLWIAYYDYQVSGGDYRLLDKPSQQAWKSFCSAAAS